MVLSFFLFILPIIAVAAAMVYFPFYRLSSRRFGKQPLSYHLPKYCLTGYLISLIFLTLLWYYPDITFRPEQYFLNLQPFVWLRQTYEMGFQKMIMQLVLNVGMFVPYGLLLPLAVKQAQPPERALSILLGSTLLIETLQYFMGRSADIDDVIMNFLGGIIGYFAFAVYKKTRS